MSQAGALNGNGGGGTGNVQTLTGNTGGAVPPTGNNINVVGTGSISVTGNPGTSTLTISSSGGGSGITTIDGDTGSATGTTITFNAKSNSGKTVLFSASGSTVDLLVSDSNSNTYIGSASGTAFGTNNVGLGLGSFAAVNTNSSQFNTGIGTRSLASQTTGASNTAIGNQSLQHVLTGGNNIAIGASSGSSYINAESSNILVGNTGNVGDTHVLRLGTNGSGTGQQSSAFIAGVAGVTVSNTNTVTIDTVTGQLGSTASSGGSVTIAGDTGSISGSSLTIFANNAANNAGATVSFVNSGTTSTLNVTDTANNNTLIGQDSGNNSSGTAHTCLGQFTGLNMAGTTANTFIGYAAGFSQISGNRCTFLGKESGINVTSANDSIYIGNASGGNYTGNESSNILIGSLGVGGENNTTRIGINGTGNGQQNQCFISGITGATPSSGNVPQVTLCDNAGNLTAISSSTAGFVLTSNGAATPSFQAAGAGTFFSITPYIVGSDVNSQYSTIQVAITQAVADGASTSTPKNIYIKPGTYSETLTGNDGIRLIGLSIVSSGLIGGPQAGSVIWDGTLTWSSGQMSFENIRAAYSGSSTVITVPASGNFTAIGCQFVGNTGTYFGTSGDNISININDCYASTANLFDSANSNVSFNANIGFIDGILSGTSFGCNFNNLTFNGSIIATAGGSTTVNAGFTNCTITSSNCFDASAAIFTSSVGFNNCYLQAGGALVLQQFGSFSISGCSGFVNTLVDTSTHTTGSAPSGSIMNCSLQESASSTLGTNTVLSLINCDGINPPTLGSGAIVQYFNTLSGNSSNNASTIINNQSISTFASDGFLYIPSCNGVPMGTPTTYGSAVPVVFDTLTNALYGYSSGTWQII